MDTMTIALAIVIVCLLICIVVVSLTVRRHKAAAQPRVGTKPALTPRKLPALSLSRPHTLAEYRTAIDALVEHVSNTSNTDTAPQVLSRACSAAVRGGKRLRATILLEVARMTGRGTDEDACDAREAALFIEYLHAASLAVDDLPSFDNDQTRRGRPALHAEFGIATALMATFSLVTMALDSMCRQVDRMRLRSDQTQSDYIGTLICSEASRALGPQGAAGGQHLDVAPEGQLQEWGPNAVARLVYCKTATFFEIAIVTGWLVAGGDTTKTDAMRKIGAHVGTAYQIADDIKDAASDAKRSAHNYANEFGRQAAIDALYDHMLEANILLVKYSLWSDLWARELFPAILALAGDLNPAADRTTALHPEQ
jgi:geranylgeranyl pyrophosphate synthase